MLSSLAPAQADVPITQFVPAYGSSLPYSAVAGAALTVGAGVTFQGSAGFAQLSDASASSAFADAFAVKAALDATSSPTALAGDLSGKTITPGVYSTDAALTMSTDMTFDAQGDTGAVFVLRTPAAINIAAGAKMHLAGGAQAANVFWSIGGAITAGASSGLVGHFYCDTAISLGAGATTSGQLFARAAIALGASTSLTHDLATPRPTLVWLSNVNPTATQGQSYGTAITVAKASSPSTKETTATFLIDSGALPAGLSLDTATGIIAGTPTTAGSYNFGIDAHVFGSTVISTTYSFTVQSATVAPTPPANSPVPAPPISPTAPTAPSSSTGTASNFPTNKTPQSVAVPSVTTLESQIELQAHAAADLLNFHGYIKLTSKDLASFATWYFKDLKAEGFVQLTPRALTGLLPEQVKSLPPATLSKMTQSQFSALSRSQVWAFSGRQINSLPHETLVSFTPKSISGLNPKAARAISNSVYRAMSPAQQRAMNIARGQKVANAPQRSTPVTKACVIPQIQAISPSKSKSMSKANKVPSLVCRTYLDT